MKDKTILILLILCTLSISKVTKAQEGRVLPAIIRDGDTIPVVTLPDIWVIEKGDWNAVTSKRAYTRLFYNVLKVYPLAKEANKRIAFVEAELKKIKDPEIQKHYTKIYEEYLRKEFSPVLKQLTFTQGKILIKLIDRETAHTSYDLIRQFRGSFQAFLWQGFASLFGANLKTEYDPEDQDKEIEEIVRLIESGKY